MKARNNSTEDAIAIVDSMLRQEEGYRIPDYLGGLPSFASADSLPLDTAARSTIGSWCIKVMKTCQYQNDTAMIAMDYVDRYVSTQIGREALLDRRQYRLLSLTCLYCAVKLHEDRHLAPAVVAKLSNGESSYQDIEKMERKILHALQWRMNPPTAMSFVRRVLDLVHEDKIDAFTRKALLDLSQLQVGESLLRYEFVSEKRSMLGLAALLNAADSACEDGSLCTGLECVIRQCTKMTSDDLAALRTQLYECISSAEVSSSSLPTLRRPPLPRNISFSKTPDVTFSDSPRTVMSLAAWNRDSMITWALL